MRRSSMMLLAVVLLGGCDRGGSEAPVGATPAGPVVRVEVSGVTPLLPGRRTHLAPTERGQLFWVQEVEGGRETVFAVGDNGLPAATKFGTATILEALKEPGVAGNIQSLAAARDGRLYFYFSGGKGRKTVAAFGAFVPRTGETQVLLDTAGLSRASEMNAALALARGSVVRSGETVWLWLRHDDGYALLSMDETRLGGTLRRGFAKLRGAGAVTPPALTSARDDLAAGDAGGLAYLDRRDGRVWRIDLLGEAAVAFEVKDLSKEVATPAADERGRLVTLAGEGPRFDEPADDDGAAMLLAATRPAGARVEYPAIVRFDGKAREVFQRGSFTGGGTNVRTLSVGRLMRDRGTFVGYDARSGEVVRLRVVEP